MQCDQGQPCRHCARRFPQPDCVYHRGDQAAEDASRSTAVAGKQLFIVASSAAPPSALAACEARGAEAGSERDAPQVTAPEETSPPVSLDRAAVLCAPLPRDADGEMLGFYVHAHAHQTTALAAQPRNQYQTDFIPLCAGSPLLARIATYTGACLLSRTRQVDGRVVMAARGRAIRALNRVLGEQAARPSDEAVAGVVSLVSTDICHDETQHLQIHFQGLGAMVRLRGGAHALGLDGLLAKLVAIPDYIAALALERPPLLDDTAQPDAPRDTPRPPPPLAYTTPLVPSTATFTKFARPLGLEELTAAILDDVRFLIDKVLELPAGADPPTPGRQKLEAVAGWVQARAQARAPASAAAPSHLHACVALAALALCRAVLARAPLSRACAPGDAAALLAAAQRVPLAAWRGLLGVLVWVLAVAAPAARGVDRALHGKSTLMVAALQMSLGDWDFARCALRRAVRLQRWLAGGPERDGEGEVGGRGGSP